MRSHVWIYYDVKLDEIVTVQRPHRRSIDSRYSVLTHEDDGVIKRCFSFDRRSFKTRFMYLGGLNMRGRSPRNYKTIYACSPGRGMSEVRIS